MRTKFKLTSETKTWFGRTLFRIEALIDFGSVKAGDKGGFVEAEENVSHDGKAWVYDDAWVSGNAWVYGDARVYGNAWVYGDAPVYGDAQVYGDACVYGNAQVYGDACVSGNACVSGDACVSPINIIGLYWAVTITDRHMQIGCERHLIEEWAEFDDRRILQMDGKEALTFWRSHKATLLGICTDTGRPLKDSNS